MSLTPRAVIVHRRTEIEELVAHHGTAQQAGFFLRSRGLDATELQARQQAQAQSLATVAAAIPRDWRRAIVERGDLSRFVFGPEDVIVAVGQDGLIANVAKYLYGQPVMGINPEPARHPGVLVRHAPSAAVALMASVTASSHQQLQLTMVEATLDDGQSLRALNELYVGHPTHQSARYRIRTPDGNVERQSSSGILIGTGTGATGWCRSAWLERRSPLSLPTPDDHALCWFVREAWPSPVTGTALTEGLISDAGTIEIVAESDLVVFGDGIESDAMTLSWGQRAVVTISPHRLRLIS